MTWSKKEDEELTRALDETCRVGNSRGCLFLPYQPLNPSEPDPWLGSTEIWLRDDAPSTVMIGMHCDWPLRTTP